MQVYGKAVNTFSNGELVWDGKFFLNQHKGQYIKRGTHGYTYNRHTAWTTTNDPINFKVNRSAPADASASTNSSSSLSETAKLQAEITKLRKENAELSNQLSAQKQDEDKYYDKTGQLIDTFKALQENLPKRIFKSIRTIIYGLNTPAVDLRRETTERATNLDVEVKSFKINSEKEQIRPQRYVKVGAIQNKIVLPTDRPVAEQKKAIMNRIKDIVELAALEKVNVLGLQ
jgi:hypothetical protein